MSEGNVVIMPVVTTLPVPVERILNAALKRHQDDPFKRVLIIGMTEGGEYFAASDADGGVALWDMERARHKLMKLADDD